MTRKTVSGNELHHDYLLSFANISLIIEAEFSVNSVDTRLKGCSTFIDIYLETELKFYHDCYEALLRFFSKSVMILLKIS